MEKEKVDAVLQLCAELKKRAQAWKDYHAQNLTDSGSKHSAALRRVSMELTRALADMRRS